MGRKRRVRRLLLKSSRQTQIDKREHNTIETYKENCVYYEIFISHLFVPLPLQVVNCLGNEIFVRTTFRFTRTSPISFSYNNPKISRFCSSRIQPHHKKFDELSLSQHSFEWCIYAKLFQIRFRIKIYIKS